MRRKPFPALIGLAAGLAGCCLAVGAVRAQESFAKLVGDVKVGAVPQRDALEVPFILWGGDVATFLANGGLATKPGTIFHGHGLNLKLTPGDNFPDQVKNYLAGKSPFLRGTLSMLGQASEVTGADPRTRPVVFLQLTWSAGDWMVARDRYKTLNDLRPDGGKKKKVALQQGGPHVGFLGDILESARLKWQDIDVVWTPDVTGDKGPAALFRKDSSVDACFAVTPDMQALTGGPDQTGNGSEGTLKGARVLVSTQQMKRSIADVYACRKDFYDAHKDVVEKFAAGYLKACEDLLEVKEKYNKDKDATARYKEILKLTQAIYGKDQGIASEADADGLISDALFVGLAGNVVFFKARGNTSGFKDRQKSALEVAKAVNSVRQGTDFLDPNLDYSRLKALGRLKGAIPDITRVVTETQPGHVPGVEKVKDADTIVYFTISFDEDTTEFDEVRYGEDFERAVKQASLFGNAVMEVRGHADIANLLNTFVGAALKRGLLRRTGSSGSYRYFLADGTEVQLKDTKKVLELIESTNFDEAKEDPKLTLKGLVTLSQSRADMVKNAVVKYAESKQLRLDKSQLASQGVGPKEPIKTVPRSAEDRAMNRRVEFRLIKVPLETVKALDY
jgi:ABC-type nitrate/sulfonate/bicarbonate transport system substrate-binding protein